MKQKIVRWGILGSASIAQKAVIPAFQRAQNAQVAAIASRSGKAEAMADKFNIPKVYHTYEELLEDPEIDAVYIPLPNSLHRQWVIAAAQAGKHILVEKPAGLNAHEVEEMIEACSSAGVQCMEAFMYRFHGQHRIVKQLINSGVIGQVRMVRASFSFHLQDKKNIRLDKKLGGGALYDVGCYGVNTLLYFLGEPANVTAKAVFSATGVDLSTAAILTYPNDVLGIIDCSFTMTDRQEYEVIGTLGKIHVPYAYRPDKNNDEGMICLKTRDQDKILTVTDDQYLNQVTHFSDCILHNQTPLYPLAETLKNIRVIEEIYEYLKKGTSSR